MKGAALKHAAACHITGIGPTHAEQNAALAEAVDLFLDFLADVKRIADAADRVGKAVHPLVNGEYAINTR